MTDSCSSCFYGRPDIGDPTVLTCCFNAPSKIILGPDNPGPRWPAVPTNGWCGDGADVTSGKPFSAVLGHVVTVATLPTGQPAGTRMFVSDSQNKNFGSAVNGGSTNLVPVYFDGIGTWYIG